MGLLSTIRVTAPREESTLTDNERARALIVRSALDEMKASSPMIGQLIGSLSDVQLLDVSNFIVAIAERIRAVETDAIDGD